MTHSFFKILFDPSSPHLSLPPNFVGMHLKNKIPHSPIIRSANGQYSWRLKIKKIGDCYCFTEGWKNVVKDIQLGLADFLVFQLVDQSTFIMWIYSPDGCEKLLPQKIEHDEDVAAGEFVNVVDENNEAKKEDDYDGNKDEENDAVNVDDVKTEENDDDPFFIVILNRTHSKLLRFPASFEMLAGIVGEGPMILKNRDGKEWVIGLKLDKSYRTTIRHYISSGWLKFRRENGLSDGAECVFKYIRSEGKLLLAKVTNNK